MTTTLVWMTEYTSLLSFQTCFNDLSFSRRGKPIALRSLASLGTDEVVLIRSGGISAWRT